MIFIILGVLIVVLIILIRIIKKYGEWEEYKPFSECYGFTDWYNKNKNTWEREKFDYFMSVFISVVTAVITTTYLLKK